MKIDTIFKILVVSLVFVQNGFSIQLGDFLPFSDISPGKGFYSDAGTFTNKLCFNVLSVTKTQQKEITNYDLKDIQILLNDIDPEGSLLKGLNLFKDDYNYLIETNAKTISLFFYSKISQTVNIVYDEKNLLTKDAQLIRDKSPTNFRFLCGDTLVSQYEEGGILFFSLNLIFNKVEDISRIIKTVSLKQKLPQLIGSVVKEAQNLKIEGKIKVVINQYGGNVYDLANIHTTSCDFSGSSDCNLIVESITKYINEVFPKGFKKDDNGVYTQSLIPLFRFRIYKYVNDMGIDIGKSALTPEIKEARRVLENEYKKYKLAYLNLVKIVNDYPVPLGITYSNLIKKSKENIAFFTSNAQNRVHNCFTGLFDKCEKSKIYILDKLDKTLIKEIEDKLELLRIFASFEVELSNDMCLRSKSHKAPVKYKIQVYNTVPSAVAVSELFSSRVVQFSGFDKFTVSVSKPDLELLQYFDFETIITENGKKLEGTMTCSGDEDSKSHTLLVSGELIEIKTNFDLK